MEYLGHVEHSAETRLEVERTRMGWSEEEHRDRIIPQLQADVDALRVMSYYESK